jgi:hypothetical protein
MQCAYLLAPDDVAFFESLYGETAVVLGLRCRALQRCMQDKAQNAIDDAGNSLQKNADKAKSNAEDAGRDLQGKAENAADGARDTAHDLKRDAQKGADRISN